MSVRKNPHVTMLRDVTRNAHPKGGVSQSKLLFVLIVLKIYIVDCLMLLVWFRYVLL